VYTVVNLTPWTPVSLANPLGKVAIVLEMVSGKEVMLVLEVPSELDCMIMGLLKYSFKSDKAEGWGL
jgi:hypothetical protein